MVYTRENLGRGVEAAAGRDEPVFTLRAQDRSAPGFVRRWAAEAEKLGAPMEKVDAAMLCAADMEAWQGKYGSKVPD